MDKVNIGDEITCKGRTVTIQSIVSCSNYGSDNQPDWYIEFYDDKDNYYYWKQSIDGGKIVHVVSSGTEFLESIETERFSIDVHQCECGFHFAMDCTYLDQIGDVEFNCPSCKKHIKIEAYDD